MTENRCAQGVHNLCTGRTPLCAVALGAGLAVAGGAAPAEPAPGPAAAAIELCLAVARAGATLEGRLPDGAGGMRLVAADGQCVATAEGAAGAVASWGAHGAAAEAALAALGGRAEAGPEGTRLRVVCGAVPVLVSAGPLAVLQTTDPWFGTPSAARPLQIGARPAPEESGFCGTTGGGDGS